MGYLPSSIYPKNQLSKRRDSPTSRWPRYLAERSVLASSAAEPRRFGKSTLWCFCLHWFRIPLSTEAHVQIRQRALDGYFDYILAEREGFEPPGPCGPTVFKTAAIDHSAISPCRTIRSNEKSIGRVFKLSRISCILRPFST